MKSSLVWYEKLHNRFGQFFNTEKILYHEKTAHHDLIIFETVELGRILALDGIVQTTERDEFIYHEMLVHVPLFSHQRAEKVLVIGGGDGGTIREICRHPYVKSVTLVEIDENVILLAKKYFPNHHQGAFDDPRLNIVINDGVEFLEKNREKFDIIISDSTDPTGPGEQLFTQHFYQQCAKSLADNGIFVAQNGVPFFQLPELVTTHKNLNHFFKDTAFYQAAIPTYYGGIMSFAWASNNPSLKKTPLQLLINRYSQISINCRYYNPEIHIASFALPQYIVDAIKN